MRFSAAFPTDLLSTGLGCFYPPKGLAMPIGAKMGTRRIHHVPTDKTRPNRATFVRRNMMIESRRRGACARRGGMPRRTNGSCAGREVVRPPAPLADANATLTVQKKIPLQHP